MSFFSRIIPAPEPRLEDALAQLAQAQRVEPITLEDRMAAVSDALHGASDRDIAAAILSLLDLIDDCDVRNAIRDCVQDATWKDVPT